MEPIRSLEQLVAQVKGAVPRRVVVAAGHDENSIQAAARAASERIATMILVGDRKRIEALCGRFDIDAGVFTIVDEPDTYQAGARARDMARNGEADVLMKGLVSTDAYMRLLLDKERGLLPRGAILTHVAVLDIPAYRRLHDKLLFVSDVAVIPAPDLQTKVKMLEYLVGAIRSFGIATPRVAILAASEKVSEAMPATVEAAIIAKMAERGQIKGAIVDGPLAMDVALSPEACALKELVSPVGGAADGLLFPNIETGNAFYKACTLLAGATLAAIVLGTTVPCVLTSRADTEESKFASIALACRVAAR